MAVWKLSLIATWSAVVLAAPPVHPVQRACTPIWGQCGGQNWTGATCCASGSSCVYLNAWHSQCLPTSGSSSTTTTTTTHVTTTTTAASTSTSATGAMCTPASGSADDTPAIEAAVAKCPSGTIVIPKGTTYNIGSQMTLSGCNGCTIQLDGTWLVTVDFDYWNGKSQVFLVKGNTDMTIYSSTGTGVVDGNGQASWDYIVSDTSYSRPKLWRISGCTGFRMTDLTIQNAPSFHVVTEESSTDVYYGDLTLYSVSTSANVAHNTDGFDVSGSYVTIENVHVTNDDDCVVLKPGADYVTARDITCVGSHGLSIGSLEDGDSVTNSIFERAVMIDSSKASGIKIWPDGVATVSNVTWKDINCDGCDYALQIQTCYGETAAYCASNPSSAQISSVVWQNITGVTSGHYDDVIANLNCPADGTCGITVSQLSATSPDGGHTVLCANTPSNIGVTCTSGASG